jgi:hypothetical protein
MGIGNGPGVAALLQNVRESFARTALALVESGRPITDAFTTKQLMMTPALMELYAFLDARHVDDTQGIADSLQAQNPGLKIYLGTTMGPIPLGDSVDPNSPNYMHWYTPDVAKLMYPQQGCNIDPVVFNANAYSLHLLLYGEIDNHKAAGISCGARALSKASVQLAPGDFTSWKLVTLRPPADGEAITTFYDLPALRAQSELVLRTPRPGFFSTPAFGANWSTNQSNQMRVTLNQALIVTTGMAVDGSDPTVPPSTPGLDVAHANEPACYNCHQTLDPTRAILQSTYSYAYYTQTDPLLAGEKGLFAFQGVVKQMASIDDFAATLAAHPLVPQAWTQKLCYWVNSSPCATDDPELQRIVSVFQNSGLQWNTLVRELVSSPIVTHTAQTATAARNGEVISVVRRDHFCAALDARLGLTDACGLDSTAAKGPQGTIPQIAAGLPSDGYGRGATAPVLPNAPTLFYRAAAENICAALSVLVVDGKAGAAGKQWSSGDPDATIADFVATMMALVPSDSRSMSATSILKSHFTAARASGATATDALRSTFIAACLAPSAIGIGM